MADCRGALTLMFSFSTPWRVPRGFSGTDILETLLAWTSDLAIWISFIDMSKLGRGPIEFSVANMMKPGVFDIDNMEPLQTRA
ncbi:MAG: hypothetical protein CM15mP74_10370 [Halieaceae bacterium]|nr:MAG: hypothetical protein CM15mP74_10370 [Halieaceae bacterium]